MNGNHENSSQRRCWDWMVVSGTCHYAKDRSAFKTYHEVGKTVGHTMFPEQTIFVAGIGTVELNVRSSNEDGTPDRLLVLENVFHIPSAICNGFSFVVYQNTNGGNAHLGPDQFQGFDNDGMPLWCGQPFRRLQKLVLVGNPQGETYLPEGGHFSLSIYLSEVDLRTVLAAASQ